MGAITGKQGAIIASFAVILLGLAGGAAWLYATKDDAPQASQQAGIAGEDINVMVAESAAPLQPGTYQEYSQANLESITGRHRVLFFHAPWCPQCRAIENDIESNGVPDGIVIFKVDYDSSQDLRQKYGVTQQTTVVRIDANGDKIASFLPYSDPTLTNALNGLDL